MLHQRITTTTKIYEMNYFIASDCGDAFICAGLEITYAFTLTLQCGHSVFLTFVNVKCSPMETTALHLMEIYCILI